MVQPKKLLNKKIKRNKTKSVVNINVGLKIIPVFFMFNHFYDLKNILNDTKYLDSVKKEKGILAKKRIEDEYTWECILSKYEKLFSDK